MRPIRLLTLALTLVAAFAAQSLVGHSQTSSQASVAGAAPAGTFDGLHFRSIGPASMSGRIADLAVYEPNPAIFYAGTAHGVNYSVEGCTLLAVLPADHELAQFAMAEGSSSSSSS